MTYCKQCLEKQRKIDELQEENLQLKAKLRYQERTANEGFFGSSTPSSKVPVKPNSNQQHQHKHGGGKIGHKGHGRSSLCQQEADGIETISLPDTCPDCGTSLEHKGSRTRTVIDCQPVKVKNILYNLERRRCPKCKKVITTQPPVFNKLLSGGGGGGEKRLTIH